MSMHLSPYAFLYIISIMIRFLVLFLAALSFAAMDDFSPGAPQFQNQESKFQRSSISQEPYVLEEAIDSSYVVGPGDFFEILSPKGFDVVQVSPEGNISVPGCGIATIKDMPLSQAKEALTKLMLTKYEEKFVQVQIVRMRKVMVSVLGAVGSPGRRVLEPQTRLAAAMSPYGGLLPMADKKNIKVIRGKDTINVDFTQYEINGVDSANILMQTGDVVYVPYTSAQSSISITTPISSYSIAYVEGLTLGEYLDKIGGVVETKAKWVRVKNTDGSSKVYELSSARDVKVLPKAEVELWTKEPYVYVGGAVTRVGRVDFTEGFHAIDYIGASGVNITTGSFSRVTRIRDGKKESINTFADDIQAGDYIEIPRSVYEAVKDVTLFLASLLSVAATAIVIYQAQK